MYREIMLSGMGEINRKTCVIVMKQLFIANTSPPISPT